MKFFVSAFAFVLVFVCFATPVSSQNKEVSAETVLQKTLDKLSGLKTVSFVFRRELNYETSGFANKIEIRSYLDFTSADKIIGTRFQFDEPAFTFVFNGSEFFTLNKKAKTMAIRKKPTFNDFDSLPGFYDSLVTLRNSLAGIIADKSIPKTFAANQADDAGNHVVEFVLDSKIMTLDGKYFATTPRKFTYRVTIDRSTFMPLEIHRTNSVNSDFSKTNFEYDRGNPVIPDDSSWFYSTYQNEYQPEKPPVNRLIKAGQPAPAWTLPSVVNDAPVSLDQFRNKVVLMEFWISFCGYCIGAVPKLNELNDKYKDREFKMIGINASDSKEIIGKFQKLNNPKYELVYDGAKLADAYGVFGFPTIVVIDKSGKVIYAGDFVPNKTADLEALIEKNL